MNTYSFHPSILRAYDIRGIYNETLFDRDAYFIGKCFANVLQQKSKNKIVVACDGRVSSPILKQRLIQGLQESGMEIVDIGVGPTPMLYFGVYELNFDAGIMITGSHNPKNHNGFKMMIKGENFHGENILELAKILAKNEFKNSDGSIKIVDIKNKYLERLLLDCDLSQSESPLLNEIELNENLRNLKIVWDAGNGSAGEIMTSLSKRIYGEHHLLFNEIDGDFPNHHPDPTEEKNLQDLIKMVRQKKCDLGIAFDGDGDRIGIVDGEGEIIWGDQLLILLARDVLKNFPKAPIIADVKASSVLFQEIAKAGGEPIMWKTGHSLIKAKMKETNAKLAGEMSGHIFFADKYYGFDDALYCAIRLLNILANSNLTLSEIRQKLPKVFATPEIRIDTTEDKKFVIVKNISQELTKIQANFSAIDGVRVNKDNGWWLIRASNTQSALVARCEADSLENLQILKQDLAKILLSQNVKLPKILEN